MYIGVDVGGTKTEAMLVDAHGRILAHVTAGSGNWEGIGLEAAGRLYAQIVATLLQQASLPHSAILAHGWGVAGLDWPSDEQRLFPLIQPLLPHAPAVIVNDAFLPLRAGSRFAYGIGVIAGTGSTVAGIGSNGQRYRTFGLGGLWGDYDGAHGLVAAAIQRLAVAHYQGAPPTALNHHLAEWSGYATIAAFAEAVSRDQFEVSFATFAPLVMQAASHGDPHATAVVTDAAEILARNAAAVINQLALNDVDFDVVLAGGVAGGAPVLFNELIFQSLRAVAPLVQVRTLACRPVIGAVLLAAELVPDSAIMQIQQSLVQKDTQ